MIQIDNLLNDDRLARLFTSQIKDCALQLWIVQIKSEQSIENRIIYGRLLPYNYSNNSWFCSDSDDYKSIGSVHAQIVRLSLYIKSSDCSGLLRHIIAGKTISEISEELRLILSEKIRIRLGAAMLANNSLAFRSVAYLLNRDSHDPHLLCSPHGSAGAFSASITQTDKRALFFLDGSYNAALTAIMINRLNSETGLQFGGSDLSRFGELELLVFPTLDDLERSLLDIKWGENRQVLIARFEASQVPDLSSFLFRLNVMNDGLIVDSKIIRAEPDAAGTFECTFKLSEHLREIIDGVELEIFGFNDAHFCEGALCCRWRGAYIREVVIQAHVLDRRSGSVKFDWLEKTTRRSVSERAKAALTVNRGDSGFTSRVGGRAADPWVTANRALDSLFQKIHPSKSEGRFFLKWGQGDGEGRLQFVEWFRALLTKHPQSQIVIFDPYFDSAGLGLLLLLGVTDADFIVFTSLNKQSSALSVAAEEPAKPSSDRVNNLVVSCELNHHLLKRFKLRIYGLKEGRLHDRYILVLGPDALPATGFTLSNSFQKAAENYPLLVAPIPADILLKVEEYKAQLVREAQAADSKLSTESPSIPLVFDSLTLPRVRRHYEPLLFLDKAAAGDVLSVWTGEISLKGLSGHLLKEQLNALGMIKEHSLALPETVDFSDFLEKATRLLPLSTIWDVLGDVLAYSGTNGDHFLGLDGMDEFLEYLLHFVVASFNRVYGNVDEEIAITDSRFFREPVETLLHSSYRIEHYAAQIKHQVLTWSEFFAIKLLWAHAPDRLCVIAEARMEISPLEPQGSDVVQLSLLSQILSELALTVLFDGKKQQQDVLLHSSNGLLRWMGLIALERTLKTPGGLSAGLQKLDAFSNAEQVRYLGWMVSRAARSPKAAPIYSDLLASLISVLPETLSSESLKNLVDSMRGHMRGLGWAEPWLFRDVVFPLLRDQRIKFDDACDLWVQELIVSLGSGSEHNHNLFDRARDGQTTIIAAFLFAQSSSERQTASLKVIKEILTRQQRIVRQPLASTSNWARWDRALVVTTWLLGFSRWCRYHLRELGKANNRELDDLAQNANDLAKFRPENEWRSASFGPHKELTIFLDQVDELLAN